MHMRAHWAGCASVLPHGVHAGWRWVPPLIFYMIFEKVFNVQITGKMYLKRGRTELSFFRLQGKCTNHMIQGCTGLGAQACYHMGCMLALGWLHSYCCYILYTASTSVNSAHLCIQIGGNCSAHIELQLEADGLRWAKAPRHRET